MGEWDAEIAQEQASIKENKRKLALPKNQNPEDQKRLQARIDRSEKKIKFYRASTPEEVEALKEEEGVAYATPDTPRVERKVVDTYRGYDITYYYQQSTETYFYGVSIEGKWDKFKTQEEAQARIDRYHYEQSPTYIQQKKAEEKARQEEYSERMMIYGIGTDRYGNPIPPTEEEIAARETFYAKEKLLRGTTLREEYEEERGVIPSAEEQERRDEALIEEAEAQGKWGNIYWLQLQAEWRKTRTELVNIVRSVTG